MSPMKDTELRSSEERIQDLERFRDMTAHTIMDTQVRVAWIETYIKRAQKISKITFTILGMFTSMNIIFIGMTFLKGLPLSVILISAFLLLGLNLIYLIR